MVHFCRNIKLTEMKKIKLKLGVNVDKSKAKHYIDTNTKPYTEGSRLNHK